MATSVPKTKWDGLYTETISEEGVGDYVCAYKHHSINSLFYDDNLKALNHLIHNGLNESVKLIYIDPPYSTGGVFQTRDLKNAYTDYLAGDEYITFMEERLRLMRQLLHPEGSIYVHLDSNMVFHVKVLMDEIFGPDNFRNIIVRKKCKPKNFTKKSYGNVTDFILFYTKSKKYTWNKAYEKWSNEKAKKEYPFVEEDTGRRYKKVPIHAPGERNGETGKPWRGKLPPKGKHWQFIPDKLDAFDARGEIYWSKNGNPRRKVYLDQSKGVPVQNIWSDFLDINNQNTHSTGYPTEKNPDLLKRIIKASSNEGDIVLDAFVGSGTTVYEAQNLNRKWIGIDSSKEAIITTLNRFRYGTKPMGDYVPKLVENNEPIAPGTLPLFKEKEINHEIPISKQVTDFSFYHRPSDEKVIQEEIVPLLK